MRITIITEYFPESAKCEISGGVESRAYYIAKSLAKKHDVTVITGRVGRSKRKERFAGITVIRPIKHVYSHKGSIFSRLRFAYIAYKTAKKIPADVVEGFNFISYIPAYYTGKKLGAKKVATYHETWIGEWVKNKGIFAGLFGSIWERYILRLNWDKIISVSEFTRNRLIQRGVPAKKITVVHNGVELNKYQKIKAKKYKNPTICIISRLTKQKRVDDAIKSLSIVKKKYPKIKLKIIGVGDEKENLQKLSKKIGLGKNIEFVGFVKKHQDVTKILKCSHIFCHPSVLEGFGMVVIEAMACGVPYVVSDIPPLKEVTHNGIGGLLFKRKDHKDLAKKIIRLLSNKSFYDKCSRDGQKLVKRYDWENIIKAIDSTYVLLKDKRYNRK